MERNDTKDTNPFGNRPDLERLAEEAVAELIASAHFATFSGRLPPRALEKLARLKQRPDDEALLEDLFAARMIALTRNEYVEEVGDDDFEEKVLAPEPRSPGPGGRLLGLLPPLQSHPADRLPAR